MRTIKFLGLAVVMLAIVAVFLAAVSATAGAAGVPLGSP
jgi:hypothetical protein